MSTRLCEVRVSNAIKLPAVTPVTVTVPPEKLILIEELFTEPLESSRMLR